MKRAAPITAMVLSPVIISTGAEGPDDSSVAMAAPVHAELGGYDQARQEAAQHVLETATAAFTLDREWAMGQIQDADNPLYHDGGLYVFVLDGSGIFVAHGATPELAGTDLYAITDIQGNNLGDLFAENRSPCGTWIEYWWPNPATESPDGELKLTRAGISSECLFDVGTYP